MTEYAEVISVVCAFLSWAAVISIVIALRKHEAAMKEHHEYLNRAMEDK